MSANILITGGAGFIGGTVIAELLGRPSGAFQPANLTAIVRSDDQAQKISELGINVLQTSLTDEKALKEAIAKHDITIVIHCASTVDPSVGIPLINALGQYSKEAGKATYFIHTSGSTAYSDKTGWPHGAIKDTDDVFNLEKQTQVPNIARNTTVAIYEAAKNVGVTPLIVVPPLVYGVGKGQCKKVTFLLPAMIRSGIKLEKVYKWDGPGRWPAVNVVDIADYYVRVIEQHILGDTSNAEGFYFPVGHEVEFQEMLEHVATTLYSRGLIKNPTVDVWPSAELASKEIGLPVDYLPVVFNSKMLLIPEKAAALQWKPIWDNKRYLESLHEEIDAIQEETTAL